jgi:uncharacterized protein (TIGR03437 family)
MDAAGNTYVTGFSGGANHPVRYSLFPCGAFYLTVFAPSGDLLQSTYLLGAPGASMWQADLALAPGPAVYVLAPWDAASAAGPLILNRLSPNPAAQPLKLACIGNAASYDSGPVAPGEIVSLFGEGLGPVQGTQPVAGVESGFPSNHAGVQVTFDNAPAPLLYVQEGQINAVAPWSLVEGQTTEICSSLGGAKTNCLTRPVVKAAPGVFTVDGRHAAALNEDGTVNSAANPARPGSVVSIFATGLGPLTPAVSDGAIIRLPLPANLLPVKVGGVRGGLIGAHIELVDPLYAGPAPFQVAGVSQINLISSGGPYVVVGPEFFPVQASRWSNRFEIYVAGP